MEHKVASHDPDQWLNVHQNLRTAEHHETEMPTTDGLEGRAWPEMKWSKRHPEIHDLVEAAWSLEMWISASHKIPAWVENGHSVLSVSECPKVVRFRP